MKRLLNFIGILFIVLGGLYGQSTPAFQSLGDASGQPLSELTSLVEVATNLRKLVTDTTSDNFTVFDVGLYPLIDSYNESYNYAQAFEDAKKKAKSLSKYYLIFSREHTKDKLNSNVKVHCEIPDSTHLTCVYIDSRNLLDQQLTNMFSEGLLQGLSIEAAETKVMEAFRVWILDKFNCCFQRTGGCGFCKYPDEMVQFLLSNGFEAFDCKVVNATTNELTLYDTTIILDNALSIWTSNGVDIKITKDALCNPNGGNILAFYDTLDRTAVSLWFHIWKNPDGSGRDRLFRLVRGGEDLMNTDPAKIEKGITYFTSKGKYLGNIT